MRLTQAQVRQLVGIGEETFRTWRKALPPLQGRLGHTPNFTTSDVLALAAVEWMVRTLGIKVGHLQSSASGLFEACEHALGPGMDACYILVEQDGAKLISQKNLENEIENGAILIPVRMLRKTISASANNVPDNAQGYLPFPLSAA